MQHSRLPEPSPLPTWNYGNFRKMKASRKKERGTRWKEEAERKIRFIYLNLDIACCFFYHWCRNFLPFPNNAIPFFTTQPAILNWFSPENEANMPKQRKVVWDCLNENITNIILCLGVHENAKTMYFLSKKKKTNTRKKRLALKSSRTVSFTDICMLRWAHFLDIRKMSKKDEI